MWFLHAFPSLVTWLDCHKHKNSERPGIRSGCSWYLPAQSTGPGVGAQEASGTLLRAAWCSISSLIQDPVSGWHHGGFSAEPPGSAQLSLWPSLLAHLSYCWEGFFLGFPAAQGPPQHCDGVGCGADLCCCQTLTPEGCPRATCSPNLRSSSLGSMFAILSGFFTSLTINSL